MGKKGAITAVSNTDAAISAEPDLDRRLVAAGGRVEHRNGEKRGCRGSNRCGRAIAFGDGPPPGVERGLAQAVSQAIVADGRATDMLPSEVPPPELLTLNAALMSRHGRSPKGKPPG